jgi:hypothetical protein
MAVTADETFACLLRWLWQYKFPPVPRSAAEPLRRLMRAPDHLAVTDLMSGLCATSLSTPKISLLWMKDFSGGIRRERTGDVLSEE